MKIEENAYEIKRKMAKDIFDVHYLPDELPYWFTELIDKIYEQGYRRKD